MFLSVCLPVCLSVCVSVCLYLYFCFALSVIQYQKESVGNQSRHDTSTLMHFTTAKQKNRACPSLLGSHRKCKVVQILRHLRQQNSHKRNVSRISKTQVQKRSVRVESNGCKRHQTSFVPINSVCDNQRH